MQFRNQRAIVVTTNTDEDTVHIKRWCSRLLPPYVGSSKDTQIGEVHIGNRRAMVIYSDSDSDSSQKAIVVKLLHVHVANNN